MLVKRNVSILSKGEGDDWNIGVQSGKKKILTNNKLDISELNEISAKVISFNCVQYKQFYDQ